MFIYFVRLKVKITHSKNGFLSGNVACAANSKHSKHFFKPTAFITGSDEMKATPRNGIMYG